MKSQTMIVDHCKTGFEITIGQQQWIIYAEQKTARNSKIFPTDRQMDKRTYGKINRRTDGLTDKQMDGQTNRRSDGWMVAWMMDRQMDRLMDRATQQGVESRVPNKKNGVH